MRSGMTMRHENENVEVQLFWIPNSYMAAGPGRLYLKPRDNISLFNGHSSQSTSSLKSQFCMLRNTMSVVMNTMTHGCIVWVCSSSF